MAFFDKLTSAAKNVMDKTGDMAKNVADKTSDVVEIGKIKMKINEEKSKIASIKKELGEYYWGLYEEGTALDEKATGLCDGIKELLKTIDGYTEEIKQIEGKDMQTESETKKESPLAEAVSPLVDTVAEPHACDSVSTSDTSIHMEAEEAMMEDDVSVNE